MEACPKYDINLWDLRMLRVLKDKILAIFNKSSVFHFFILFFKAVMIAHLIFLLFLGITSLGMTIYLQLASPPTYPTMVALNFLASKRGRGGD